MSDEERVLIRADPDIVTARQKGREMASQLSMSGSDLTFISAAISEVARNILVHARQGQIEVSLAQEGNRRGITVVARDEGPGIPDIGRAMQDGFSTGQGLGLGLPGAKRLMDEFEIVSVVGHGTTVIMKKWAR